MSKDGRNFIFEGYIEKAQRRGVRSDRLGGNGHGNVMPDFCQQYPFMSRTEMNLSQFSCPVVRKLSVAASEDAWQPLQMFYFLELKVKAVFKLPCVLFHIISYLL